MVGGAEKCSAILLGFLQAALDALSAAGCERVFTEKASGAQRYRPELQAALDYMREGDALVVWRLDRLARSLKQLITTVEDLEARGIGCWPTIARTSTLTSLRLPARRRK